MSKVYELTNEIVVSEPNYRIFWSRLRSAKTWLLLVFCRVQSRVCVRTHSLLCVCTTRVLYIYIYIYIYSIYKLYILATTRAV